MLAGERERAESEPKNLTKRDSEQNKHEINRERDGRQKTAESLPEVDRREPAAAAAAGREERVREGAQRGEDRRFEIRASDWRCQVFVIKM